MASRNPAAIRAGKKPFLVARRDVSAVLDMTILALETSCDETAVAVLRGGALLASEVASQIADHQQYGGVVPEIASRNHLLHAPRLLERATQKSGVALWDVDAFAATSGPGLASSLMIGASMAKGLALGFGRPYLAINHLEGHLLSPFFRGGTGILPVSDRKHSLEDWATFPIEPNVSLIVSGGHTLLVEVRGLSDYKILGRTVDDAAGEAFDKVAKMLGLAYPGGPEIERHARSGDPERFDLPRSMLDSRDLNFSFSGLKTAVRYLLPKIGWECAVIPSEPEGSGRATASSTSTGSLGVARDDRVVNDLCASFQQAVIDVLREKSLRAVRQTRSGRLTLSGGVSCNRALRENLREACEKNGIELLVAEPWLCTDNAAMIAFAAMLRLEGGFISGLADEIDPNLALR
ncbi:MAG TPA: tRNA (adenosine(37)-N6)-threonylcarbamoyltransferase complex transferase subunit TsaD [Chthoniobacterales bacterium]